MTTKRKRIFDQGLSRQKRALRIPTTGAGEDHRDKTKYTRKKKHRTLPEEVQIVQRAFYDAEYESSGLEDW